MSQSPCPPLKRPEPQVFRGYPSVPRPHSVAGAIDFFTDPSGLLPHPSPCPRPLFPHPPLPTLFNQSMGEGGRRGGTRGQLVGLPNLRAQGPCLGEPSSLAWPLNAFPGKPDNQLAGEFHWPKRCCRLRKTLNLNKAGPEMWFLQVRGRLSSSTGPRDAAGSEKPLT